MTGGSCCAPSAIGGPCGFHPGVEHAGRNERRLFVLGHAIKPARACLFARHRAVSRHAAGIGVRKPAGLADPDRRIERKPRNFIRMRDGVSRRRERAPGPAEQGEPRNGAAGKNEIDRGGDILDRGLGAHDRRIGIGTLRHFRRARGFAVAAQIEQINVVAARGDVIHPRAAFDRQIEGGVRGVSGAVDEQHRAFGAECAHLRRPLVAHENLDAGIARRHHEVFGGERLGLIRQRRSSLSYLWSAIILLITIPIAQAPVRKRRASPYLSALARPAFGSCCRRERNTPL